MEIDDGEPTVKRLNLLSDKPEQMTMVADRLELQEKLGQRYTNNSVKERLGGLNRELNISTKSGKQ